MYCYKCGAKLDDDARFCTSCGTKVEEGPIPAEATGGEPLVHFPAGGAGMQEMAAADGGREEFEAPDDGEETKIIGQLPHRYDTEENIEHVDTREASKPERVYSETKPDAAGGSLPDGGYTGQDIYTQPGIYGGDSPQGQRNIYGPQGAYGQGSTYGQGDAYGPQGAYGQGSTYGQGDAYGPQGIYGQGSTYGQGNMYGHQAGYGQNVQGAPYGRQEGYYQQEKPKKGMKGGVLALIIVGAVLACCGIGFLIWSMTGGKSTPEKTISKLEDAFNNKDLQALIDLCDSTSAGLLKVYAGVGGEDLIDEMYDDYENFSMELTVKDITYDGSDKCVVEVKSVIRSDNGSEKDEVEIPLVKEKGKWKLNLTGSMIDSMF